MTAGRALLDTGVLVAYLHRDDRHHEKCLNAFRSFRGLFITTEAVLTESMYLVAGIPGGHQTCLEIFIRGGMILVPATRASLRRCQSLMSQYSDIPMDFADATLVALAEETGVRDIYLEQLYTFCDLDGRGSVAA
ncbi:MAG: PIN domain-containing protein, partial [Candidatus Methylomirabilales bacterium]